MKKTKSLIAFLLALTLLTPSLLIVACSDQEELSSEENSSFISNSSNSETLENNTSSSEESDSMSSEQENSSSLDTSIPPQSSTPQTPPSQSAPPTQSSPPENSSSGKEEPEEPPTSKYVEYIRCTGDNVNIRAGAGTNYSVLGSAEKGTMYAVIGKKGNWYKTYYKNKTAYVYAEYASVFSLQKSEDTDVENVIEEGYKLLGVPYVYGAVRLHDGKGKLLAGFTAQKFDCSSLMQYIFYKGADVLLDVHTRAQVVQGKYVKRANLQRGDCIYFTNESRQHLTGIERVGHVALYLGNDYILHTSSDYARIEKMTATRWKYYIEARRFL
jgi:peptidoglycan endopeptidase LytE